MVQSNDGSTKPLAVEEKFHDYPWHAPRFWQGMRFGTLVQLVWENGFAVRPGRWGLLFTCTVASVFNTVMHKLHWLIYERKIQATELTAPPIFIIGHWRSGTTHLHELMVQDPRFGFPTTYECFAPHHALLTQNFVTRWFAWVVPAQRPMDNMIAGWHRPQEDEFALCNMGVGSNYRTVAFPLHPQDIEFLDFQGVSPARLAAWKAALRWFMKMVTFRSQKQIVLKSPPHTGRIRVLLEMFPDAKFIYIARDPYVVYSSTLRLWKSLYWLQSFQHYDPSTLSDYVIECFNRMCGQFDRDKHLIPTGQLCELRYEDLVANPLAEIQRIYRTLELQDFERARPNLEAYLATQKNYQTNRYEIPDDIRRLVDEHWGWYAQKYGYSPTPPRAATPEPVGA